MTFIQALITFCSLLKNLKIRQREGKKKVLYKISVTKDFEKWFVKAVSLKESEARVIVDELITCGIIARYSPHLKSKSLRME